MILTSYLLTNDLMEDETEKYSKDTCKVSRFNRTNGHYGGSVRKTTQIHRLLEYSK